MPPGPRPKDFPSLGKRIVCALLSYTQGFSGVDRILKNPAYRDIEVHPSWDAVGQDLLYELLSSGNKEKVSAVETTFEQKPPNLIVMPTTYKPRLLNVDRIAEMVEKLRSAEACPEHQREGLVICPKCDGVDCTKCGIGHYCRPQVSQRTQ